MSPLVLFILILATCGPTTSATQRCASVRSPDAMTLELCLAEGDHAVSVGVAHAYSCQREGDNAER